jgi:hypothetical protein
MSRKRSTTPNSLPTSAVEGTGPFFFDRLPIPTQVFTDAAEALAFLRGLLPGD